VEHYHEEEIEQLPLLEAAGFGTNQETLKDGPNSGNPVWLPLSLK
jgi:hypothetical protein